MNWRNVSDESFNHKSNPRLKSDVVRKVEGSEETIIYIPVGT